MNKKKYAIICFVNKFQFPLREALRKQVWWLALSKLDDFEVTIYVFDSADKSTIIEGVNIVYLDKNDILGYLIKAEIVHFVTSIVEVRLLSSIICRGQKKLTIGDGEPLGTTKKQFRKLLVKLLPMLFSDIYIFSQYQRFKLNLKKVTIIQPFLPAIKPVIGVKSSYPSILYMGHLSHFKGVGDLFFAFTSLKKNYPKLKLVVANNMVHGDEELLVKLTNLVKEYPDDVIIKGIVNPIEELCKAWIYVYPFTKAGGTLAFALSLYESKMCGTPFISCDVGANSEFFDNSSLIKPNDKIALVEKLTGLLDDLIKK